jgi:alpha-L-rhamnosidase
MRITKKPTERNVATTGNSMDWEQNWSAGARWIWPEVPGYHLHNCYALFRKVFTLKTKPSKATAIVTADQNYRLWVNGRPVCRGPARGYQASWPFDEVDLAPFLRKGRNVISARVYNCGHATFSYLSEGVAGFLFAARVGTEMILTGESWRCRLQSGIRREMVPYSLQLGVHQEAIDLRVEDPAWLELNYDDSDWGLAGLGRAPITPPYYALEARGLPLMREWKLRPKCLGSLEGSNQRGWQTSVDLASLRADEPLGHQPMAKEQMLHKITVPATRRGRFRSYIFDFGRVVVGSPVIKINHAKGGETIDFLHTEALAANSLTPLPSRNDHSHIRLANRLICRQGKQSHSFQQQLGFRYMIVTVRENPQSIGLELSLDACGYPMEGDGAFESADRSLNAIWQACAHTQRICSLDAYVDTPWREQAQWWGDARIQAWNTFHLSGDTRLLRRGIRILAGQVNPEGLTYGHAPTIAHSCVLPDFCLIWLLTLWDDYWQTGSAEMFLKHMDRVESILGYFRRQADPKTGLPIHDPRFWLFLDWRPIQKDGQPALLALWLLYTLGRLAVLSKAAGQAKYSQSLSTWKKDLQKQVLQHLLRSDGLVCDGLNVKGKPVTSTSLQSQTLAWMCDLPGLDRKKVLDTILLPWVHMEKQTPLDPSAYWCAYPLELLASQGYGAEVVAFIRNKWAEMATYGSAFEDFDARPQGKDISSHSHAWSAHPLYLLMQILAGIKQAAPGWKAITQVRNTRQIPCRIVFPTPHGTMRVERKVDAKGQLQTHITKPDTIQLISN